MKIKQLPILVLITGVFAAFTLGFFLGRNTGHQPVQLTTALAQEELVMQAKVAPIATEAAEETVPIQTEAETQATEPTEAGPININTATLQQLDSLPGVGSVLAQRIIDYREANGPFSTVEELICVSGIGEKKLEAIIELITAE